MCTLGGARERQLGTSTGSLLCTLQEKNCSGWPALAPSKCHSRASGHQVRAEGDDVDWVGLLEHLGQLVLIHHCVVGLQLCSQTARQPYGGKSQLYESQPAREAE